MFEEFAEELNKIPKYQLCIGVYSADTGRQEKIKVGLNNAEILFINENGAPLKNIPARPVLEQTLKYAKDNLLDKTIDKAIEKYLVNFDLNAFEYELDKMCVKMENYAKKLIYDNDGAFKDNAKSTIKKKGFNHPLFETGQLAKSITCKIEKA